MRSSRVICRVMAVLLLSSGTAFSQDATGACCVGTNGCTVITAAECAAAGGSYQGDGSSCSPNPCDCCGADGTEMRGNADGIGGINVLDVIRIVQCALIFDCFEDCKLEHDVNASGSVSIVDVTYLVAYLFRSGPAPAMCP